MGQGARELTYAEAIREALAEEMRRDPRVIIMGEDIGVYGGAFRITAGLYEEFGPERVRDTPISETAIVGAATGAAVGGLIPVVEIQYLGFCTIAVDQIVSHAAFLRYMSGGQLSVPFVVRAPVCQHRGAGAQHSLSAPISWFAHVPGLKVVAPSTPYDAKGLLKAAIRDPDPVLYLEHAELYRRWNKGSVPEDDYTVPIGKAGVRREGGDVVIVAYSLGVHRALAAAAELERMRIGAEVIDLRTLSPLDKPALIDSVKKVGRLVIVDIDYKTCGVGGELAASVVEEALDYLDAPVKRVATADVPTPFSPALERAAHPTPEQIVKAAKEAVGRRGAR